MNTTQNADTINSANKSQISQALVVQTYANSVLAQPQVDLSNASGLTQYQTQINAGITTAQAHANYYLNTLEPAMIQNMANIENYYQLHIALPETLPANSTAQEWVAGLSAIMQASQAYQSAASGLVRDITSFHAELAADAQAFATTVTELNAAVGGDNGALASIQSQLDSIQGQIDGAIAGIVASSLTIAGGTFLICVGAIGDFVTAGTSSSAVIGGVGIVATGAAGEVGASVALADLNNQKAHLLAEEASLKSEVKLAKAISAGYSSLSGQVTAAISAASNMENAWNSAISDLGSLISDLNNGIQAPDNVRSLWVRAADGSIQTVLADVATIKTQMAGVQTSIATDNQTVADVINMAIQKNR